MVEHADVRRWQTGRHPDDDLMPNRVRGMPHIIEDIQFNKGQTGVKEGVVVELATCGTGRQVRARDKKYEGMV